MIHAKVLWRAIIAILIFWALLLTLEVIVRRFAPQEVLGWGERAALQPDPDLGWRLSTSRETRLRWLSYDYRVVANGLGFPGPDYRYKLDESASRIMTVGGGYTSAEGVDTDQAWPRLLEDLLNVSNCQHQFQVFNFAVTGYGPEQYLTVVEQHVSAVQPQFVLVAFAAGDFNKVGRSMESRRQGVGFDLPDQAGLRSFLTFKHLGAWVGDAWSTVRHEWIWQGISPRHSFFGQVRTVDRRYAATIERTRPTVDRMLRRLRSLALEYNFELRLVMVPAGVQVCQVQQLPYLPESLNLEDPDRYDLDQPQTAIRELALASEIGVHDLRQALRSDPKDCPYQPANLHWTVSGHRLVASYVADLLIAESACGETKGWGE